MLNKSQVTTLIPRIILGMIFLSEGLQKFITPELVGAGRFAKIGFLHANFWATAVGLTEIICAILLLLGLLSRLASVPLLIIMVVAFITTKIPTLLSKGFWTFAHEYRTDFAMSMLLILIIYSGGGRYALDEKIFGHGNKR